MSKEHKELLRLAAEKMDTANGEGMCYALRLALGDDALRLALGDDARYSVYRDCRVLLYWLYCSDSPESNWAYWMGELTYENQQHRVMALLFAAEAYDDMEGV